MTPRRKGASRRDRARVLVIAMVFMLVFSALAVSLAAMSGTNVQLTSNHHKINAALASAQSGQDVMRFWFSGMPSVRACPTQALYEAVLIIPCEWSMNLCP